MAEKSDGGAPWRAMEKEEMTRHQALFYSQAPIEGLLPGEKARELFLRSQLPLPILSQIWNLVDTPHDNMLDVKEFVLAMHLLQSYLRGRKLPQTLPPPLRLPTLEEVHLPSISLRDMLAYSQLFQVLDTTHMNFIDAITSRDVLVTSGLSVEHLAAVWNLADVDRDSKLSLDEFGIACHIIRYVKKGGVINGPVNVQSLLPHRTLRHDLQTKKRRLTDLENRKLRLMALREKRKNQAIQETKRAHLYRERLNALRQWHDLVCEEDSVSIETVLHLGDQLKEEEDKVTQTEAVAHRLNEDHGLVRAETARVIMHEHKLTQDIDTLEEEADKQRKKRQRNSLIKDLDPFHQLHEERKEERMMGSKRPKKVEKPVQHKIEIPHKIDPFDRSKIHHKALSGEELFGVKSDQDMEENEGKKEEQNPWGGPVDEKLLDLTRGFEDDFVDVWSQAAHGKAPEDLLNAEENFFNCNLESEDQIFRTVPVTAEEDELWRSLSPDELALQNEQLRRLQLKLNSIQRHIEQLGPDKVIMENQLEESRSEGGTPGRRNPIGRRRISSDGTLEIVGGGGGGTSPASPLSLFTKRAYGDVYSRNKRLQEYTTRRSLSEPGKSLIGLSDDIRTGDQKSDTPLNEVAFQTLEKVETSSSDTVQKSHDVEAVHESSPEEAVLKPSDNERRVDSNDNTLSPERKAEKKTLEKDDTVKNTQADISDGQITNTVSEKKEDSQLTPPESVPEPSIHLPSEEVENVIKTDPDKSEVDQLSSDQRSELDAQSVIPCDTLVETESKVDQVDTKASNQVVTEESQVNSERVEQSVAESSIDGRLDTVSAEKEGVEQPIVVRRLNKPSPESEQYRSSLPPNFFSEHTSPVPPPRRNSPKKKIEKGRAGSFQGPATTGRRVLLPGHGSPRKISSDKKIKSDLNRPLYISTSPNTPVKGLHTSPVPQSSNTGSPQKQVSPKRPAPKPSISRSRPHSIACPETTQSNLKGQTSSPIAPPRSKRKSSSTRKPRQSSAPSDIPSRSSDVSDRKTNNVGVNHEFLTDSKEGGQELSAEELSEMEARQRRLELEQMRNKLFGYNEKLPGDEEEASSPSNAVVLKLGEDDEGQIRTSSPSDRVHNQVVIDVAEPEFSQQRASTTVSITKDQQIVNATPEFKSRIKLSFSDESDDFNNSFNSPVDINKSANDRLDSLIRDDGVKPYKTVVDLNGSDSPRNAQQNVQQGSNMNGDQKSRIVLDLDDHQYRPTTRDVPAISTITADEEYMLQGKAALDNAKHVYKTDIFVSSRPEASSSPNGLQASSSPNGLQASSSPNGLHSSNTEESESSGNLDVSSGFAKSENELSGDSDISDDEGTFQATFDPGKHQPSVIDTRTMIKLDDDGDSGITLVSYHNRSQSDSFEQDKVPSPRRSTGVTLSLSPVITNVPTSSPPSDPEPDISTPRLIKMTRSDGQQVEPAFSPRLKMEARSTVVPLEEPKVELEEEEKPVSEPVISPTRISPKSESFTALRPDPMSFFEPEQTRSVSTPKVREISRPPQNLSPPGPSDTREIHKPITESPTCKSPTYTDPSPGQTPSPGLRPDPMSFFDPEITQAVTSPRARELKRPAPAAPVVNLSPPRRLTSPPGVRELKRPAPSPPGLDPNPTTTTTSNKTSTPTHAPPPRAPPYDNNLSAVAQTGTTVFHSGGLKSINTLDESVSGVGSGNDNHLSGGTEEGSNLTTHLTQPSVYESAGGRSWITAEEEEGVFEEVVKGEERRRTNPNFRLSGDSRTEAYSLSPSSITTGGASFTASPRGAHNKSNTPSSSTPDLLVVSSTITTTTGASNNSGGGGGGGGGGGDPEVTNQGEKMDPITGLRKTGPISAMDKAMKFMATTEPSFRVKVKDAASEQVEGERATLIDSMRVRRKKLDTWVPGDEVQSPTESPQKSLSEMKYERRKHQQQTYTMPQSESPATYQSHDSNKSAPPDVIPNYRYRLPTDIDARSINQESTKRLWEDQIASGEVAILPRPDNRKKTISTQDVTDFKSEVESEPLNLYDVKKQWELKAEEMAKDQDGGQKMSTSKSYDSLSMGKTGLVGVGGGGGLMSNSQSYDSLSKVNNQRQISSGPGEVDTADNSQLYESAIDREIRLAEERETELRREKEARIHLEAQAASAIVLANHNVPKTANKTATTSLGQEPEINMFTQKLPEPSPLLQKESIIEREIREQERREELLRHEGQIPTLLHTNKEHEQSEYERQEKEQERISAHESIVEREIRLQREREQEILNLRSKVYKDKRPSVSDSVDGLPEHNNALPDTNGHSGLPEIETPTEVPEVPQPIAPAPIQPTYQTPANSAPGMTTSISYEDAISTYAHAGESMIARELREQKEREEELRRRWREELGIESPLQNSEPDTPFNMPDPVQPRYQQQRSMSKPSPVSQTRAPENGISALEPESQKKPSRVQPMPVEDDRDPYRYVPQYETPIEREIRLAREREVEFRQMKGLSLEQNNQPDHPVVLDVKAEGTIIRPQILHRKGEEPVQEKATMKRLAHSRLQQEIEVERQRELDLQRHGHISTVSDDRKGDPARYVEVVTNKESSPVTPTVPQPVATPPVEEKIQVSTPVLKSIKSPTERTGKRSLGELKIEQELREMREREEELRTLRLATSHRMAVPGEKPTSNGSVIDHTSPDQDPVRPAPTTKTPSAGAPGDTVSKAPRRKTNLAAEWEKKFSGSS